VTELLSGSEQTVAERFRYGDATETCAQHNQCGQLVRHEDLSGCRHLRDYGIFGEVLMENRRFLKTHCAPDWPADVAEREQLLESDNFTSTWHLDAARNVIEQIDAGGHTRLIQYSVCGQLKSLDVLPANAANRVHVVTLNTYNASGHVVRQSLGNEVTSRYAYSDGTGFLQSIKVRKADGTVVQDLQYRYDAVGNVICVEDAAQSVRHVNNRIIRAISSYRYDSLYQLREASGRERPTAFTVPLPTTTSIPINRLQLTEYTQRFDYDAAGNLITRHHTGQPTWHMAVSGCSNRSLQQRSDGSLPGEEEIMAAFNYNGSPLLLAGIQALTWNLRNQLQRVTFISRGKDQDDYESYAYDGAGLRLQKTRISHAAGVTHVRRVRYLPGLEIRSDTAKGETLHVVDLPCGRNSARILRWHEGLPSDVSNGQMRYSLNDHLGSCAIELDYHADVISHEAYYPFGGTAWHAARSETEASYKSIRYNGKERDATGLYYYGLRYYAPGQQRWAGPDPERAIDGLNLYAFVSNNPINRVDPSGGQGMSPDEAARVIVDAFRKRNARDEARSMLEAGQIFAGHRTRGETLQTLMQHNIRHLRSRLKTLDDEEKSFYGQYLNTDFFATHATDNDAVIRQADGLSLRSHRSLTENEIDFDPKAGGDIGHLANQGYVFFSLESGPTLAKPRSNFGETIFRIPFDSSFKHGHVVLLDQLLLRLPMSEILGFSDAATNSLQRRTYEQTEIMFDAPRAKSALGLSIILAARDLPATDRTRLLAATAPEDMNILTNKLFRPELRQPRYFHTKKAQRFNTSYQY
jgi:RHS repeat-associated protein